MFNVLNIKEYLIRLSEFQRLAQRLLLSCHHCSSTGTPRQGSTTKTTRGTGKWQKFTRWPMQDLV
jgi:hypothetical protein